MQHCYSQESNAGNTDYDRVKALNLSIHYAIFILEVKMMDSYTVDGRLYRYMTSQQDLRQHSSKALCSS